MKFSAFSCFSLIRISREQDLCSSYREIRIIESILKGFLKDDDLTYVPIRERFGLERFGLERFNCIMNSTHNENRMSRKNLILAI